MPEIPDSVKKKSPRQRAAEIMLNDLRQFLPVLDLERLRKSDISAAKAHNVCRHYAELREAFIRRAEKATRGTK